MRVRELRFDIDTINECIQEISEPIGDRTQFLYNCILDRLNKINKTYSEDFNIQLLEVEQTLDRQDADLKTLSIALKKLYKLSNSLHIVALELLDIL